MVRPCSTVNLLILLVSWQQWYSLGICRGSEVPASMDIELINKSIELLQHLARGRASGLTR